MNYRQDCWGIVQCELWNVSCWLDGHTTFKHKILLLKKIIGKSHIIMSIIKLISHSFSHNAALNIWIFPEQCSCQMI